LGLAVDERDLFWIRENEAGEMEVGSATKEGGPGRVLARLPPRAWHVNVIATDESAVYFGGADSEGVTGVFAVAKAGGETRAVAPFGAVGLLVDSSGLYIAAPSAEPQGIYAVTAENAEPVHVPGTEVGVNRELASDETYLYWSSGSTLFRVPKAGGRATIVREDVESYPGLTAVDSGLIYWLGDGWLQRAPVVGGTATLLAEFRAESLEARDGTAYSIGLDQGIKGLLHVNMPGSVDFTRGAFTALALDETFTYVARCEFVCLLVGMPADCYDYEYNVALVRLPRP
jgi:hypothetical protein